MGRSKKIQTKNFLDFLGTHFLICTDRIPGRGEDSGIGAFTSEAGLVGVFDGCGGLGARSCVHAGGKTEAYLASRSVCNAARQWFAYNGEHGYGWDTGLLKQMIISNLQVCQKFSGGSDSRMRGSMVRPYPSTLAMAALEIRDGMLQTHHFWAGDSRTYLLDADGIGQVSIDDINGADALRNLTQDGSLTNVLSSDENFVIHSTTVVLDRPCIVFCASDGCFGYVPSPMDFEYLLLSTLESASSTAEWEEMLRQEIFDRAGDDQSLSAAAFGFGTFQEMQQYYCGRYEQINWITDQYEHADEARKDEIWNAYRPGYYRFISGR